MNHQNDIRQIETDALWREYFAARALLFSPHRLGIERKIELRTTIGKCSQELLSRQQQERNQNESCA